MIHVERDTWVLIHRSLLAPEERAPQVPEDTRQVPLEMWVKGYLQADAMIGDEVTVTTLTGRCEKGRLIEAEPSHHHDFGNFVPELQVISCQVRAILFAEEAGDEKQ